MVDDLDQQQSDDWSTSSAAPSQKQGDVILLVSHGTAAVDTCDNCSSDCSCSFLSVVHNNCKAMIACYVR